MSSSEEKELRAALENAQHEAKELRGRVGELTAFKPEELLARIHELEASSGELRMRLERADKVREEWDARVQRLCSAATQIRAVFRGRAQDIEWLVQGDLVVMFRRDRGPSRAEPAPRSAPEYSRDETIPLRAAA